MNRMTSKQFVDTTFRSLRKLSMKYELPETESPFLTADHQVCRVQNMSPAFDLVIANLIHRRGFQRDQAFLIAEAALAYISENEGLGSTSESLDRVKIFAVSAVDVIQEYLK